MSSNNTEALPETSLGLAQNSRDIPELRIRTVNSFLWNPTMKKTFLSALILSALALSWSANASSAGFLADRHAQMGLKCESCHGPDAKNPEPPTIETCTQCHPTQSLVEKTKNVKPRNPHVSPHYQDKLECTNCHLGHEKSEDFWVNFPRKVHSRSKSELT